MRKARGTPKPPTHRAPAPELRQLSPQERLQELLETRRFDSGWRERRPPPKALSKA